MGGNKEKKQESTSSSSAGGSNTKDKDKQSKGGKGDAGKKVQDAALSTLTTNFLFYPTGSKAATWKVLATSLFCKVPVVRGYGKYPDFIGSGPFLRTPDGFTIAGESAIVRFLSMEGKDKSLRGLGDASVSHWLDWDICTMAAALESKDATKLLECINYIRETLQSIPTTELYLVGDQLTLADICIAPSLVEALEYFGGKDDEEYRN